MGKGEGNGKRGRKRNENKRNIPTKISSAPKVGPDSALQPTSTLAQKVGKVLQVVAGGDTKLPDEVLSCGLQVAVILGRVVLLRAAEVGVGRDGGGALESLQSGLGLGLCVGIEGTLAEELVRRDGLLAAKLVAGVFLAVVCYCC